MKRIVYAVLLGVALWAAGFVAGSVAYAVPHLRHIHPVPGLAFNWAVSILALLVWAPLLLLFSRRFVRSGASAAQDGVLLGGALAGANLLLDRIVVVGWLGMGASFHHYASIWVAYLLAASVPIVVGVRRRGGADRSGEGG